MDEPQNVILFDGPRAAIMAEDPGAAQEMKNGQAAENGLEGDQASHTECFHRESQQFGDNEIKSNRPVSNDENFDQDRKSSFSEGHVEILNEQVIQNPED